MLQLWSPCVAPPALTLDLTIWIWIFPHTPCPHWASVDLHCMSREWAPGVSQPLDIQQRIRPCSFSSLWEDTLYRASTVPTISRHALRLLMFQLECRRFPFPFFLKCAFLLSLVLVIRLMRLPRLNHTCKRPKTSQSQSTSRQSGW